MSATLLLLVGAFGMAAVAILVIVHVDPSSTRRRAQAVAPSPTRAVEVARADYGRLFRRASVASRAFWQMRVAPRWHDADAWCRTLAGQIAARARTSAASEATRRGEQSPPPFHTDPARPIEERRPPMGHDEQRVA
jgi:hypothetical protein